MPSEDTPRPVSFSLRRGYLTLLYLSPLLQHTQTQCLQQELLREVCYLSISSNTGMGVWDTEVMQLVLSQGRPITSGVALS